MKRSAKYVGCDVHQATMVLTVPPSIKGTRRLRLTVMQCLRRGDQRRVQPGEAYARVVDIPLQRGICAPPRP